MVDPRVSELAKRSVNFGFLLPHEPLLVSDGVSAESYVYADPNASMFRARQFGEALARHLVGRLGLKVSGTRQVDRLRALSNHGALHSQVLDAFDEVRSLGNEAVHNSHYANVRDALHAVERCFFLGDWLHRASTDDRTPRTFVAPQQGEDGPEPSSMKDRAALEELRAELDEHRARLVAAKLRFDGTSSRLDIEERARRDAEEQLAAAAEHREALRSLVEDLSGEVESLREQLERARPARVSAAERERLVDRARDAAARPPLNEAQVRERIDRMLDLAGWAVQDVGVENLSARRGVAVREVPTASGRADYLLYVDRALVGVVEAKREGADLSAAQAQAARYASALTLPQRLNAKHRPLPFQYVSDGNEVRVTNRLDPDFRSRTVFAVHRPETLARWLHEAERDPEHPTLRARMRTLPGVPLDPSRLRAAQVRAVEGLERSLADDQPRSLIQMATGAGKTYTAATFSYRLLRHAGARRILFLVDRNTLGKQAEAEFEAFVPPGDGRRFGDLYNVQRLSGAGMLDSSSVVICTIQRLWMLLTGRSVDPDDDDPALDSYELADGPVEVSYNPVVPPETFDLIVVDECHRSIYGRWRAVLEYFDAHVVGLTATPVAQTFGFFRQNLVSEYTYAQAVADRVNVDFDVYRIRTELTERGATIDAGTVVPVRDRWTRRQRYRELDDDLDYTPAQLARQVVSKGQLKLVLETFRDRLFTEIFPGRREVPKTLVFAVDDNHAEEIVATVREVFGRGDEFCAKITHRAARREDLLQELRTSPALRIAVTVDLIATGTDVKPLECVFFLRNVKSWAYFEQMKGRGARTIDPAEFEQVTPDATGKDRFVIVDAVGVTESERVDARPLNRLPERTASLETLLGRAGSLTLDEDGIATLASRLSRLDEQMDDGERAEVEALAGGRPLRDIVGAMVKAVDADEREAARERGGDEAVRAMEVGALEPLASNPALRQRVLEIRRAKDIVYDEVNADRLIEARGVAPEELAMRTVTSFHDYVEEHRAEITVLDAAYRAGRSPREVYREVQELARRIARPPHSWTPEHLLEAYDRLGKVKGRLPAKAEVVELLGVLRYELGLDEAVRPYRSLVEERFAAWLARQEQAGAGFGDEHLWWLGRIVDVVATSAGIDPLDLDQAPFTERGGVDGFISTFGDARAESLITELNKELPA